MRKYQVENLEKSFQERLVLENISFTLEENTITGLIGRNGAGKTTLIKCLTSFYKDYKGYISFVENEIKRPLSPDDISYIPDQGVYYDELTLLEHLKFIGAMNKTEEKIDQVIKTFYLDPYLENFPHELSKGTLQRMIIALAILRNRDLIIADEPFDGLDPVQVKVLQEEFLKLKDQGKSILISSHLLDLVEKICDNFIVIDRGKILYISPRQEDAQRPMKEDISQIFFDLVGE